MHVFLSYNRLYHGVRLQAILMVLLFCMLCNVDVGVAQTLHEGQIKSVFLYNLTHFVIWPTATMKKSPVFNIGVYGNTSFQEVLKQTVEIESKDGRPIVVSTINNFDEITDQCRILFIANEVADDWEKIHKRIAGLPILTVSDRKDFTRRGGMVSLLRQNNNIRIEVNYVKVQQAGLSMSAKLLRLTKIVE